MKIFAISVLIFMSLAAAPTVFADGGEPCTVSYGQPVNCGVEKEHIPVDAGLGDIDPAVIGGILLVFSPIAYYFSRKTSVKTLT